MKQLDDFEKYLRDQLKGHIEPEPLMWQRLTDALGRVQPWYARSAFKYALTAFGSLLIGVVITYTYLEHQYEVATHPTAQHSTRKTAQPSIALQTKQLEQKSLETEPITEAQVFQANIVAQSNEPIFSNESVLHNRTTEGNLEAQTVQGSLEAFQEVEVNQKAQLEAALAPLSPSPIQRHLSSLQERRIQIVPNSNRFNLSIATGQTYHKLPVFDYQLGPVGTHKASVQSEQSPLFQLQVHLFKNWHLNAGIQHFNSTITEQFKQIDVFSYDEEEHYLFPYIYGFRQISDEELHDGPWPSGSNPPGGGDVSHVQANYNSEVRNQHIFVPFTLSYHKQIGVFEAQLHAGIGLNFSYRTSETLYIPGYAPSTINIKQPYGQMQALAQSQLRLSYLANKHLAVFIEPQIRSAFQVQNELNTLPYRNNTRAIYAGLSWKF